MIEMIDVVDKEVLYKESFNVDVLEINGGVNFYENQSLEGEEVEDLVRIICIVFDLLFFILCVCRYSCFKLYVILSLYMYV